MKQLMLKAGGGHSAGTKTKSLIYFAFAIVLMSVSFSIAQDAAWVSFVDGTVKRGLQTVPPKISYDNLQVTHNGIIPQCKLNFKFPGAFLWYPDDNGLLAGKYAAFNFHTDPGDVKLYGANYNGVLRPDKLGQPDLPLILFQVRIPSSVSRVSVTVANENFKPVEGTFNLVPVQERLVESFVLGVDIDPRTFQRDNLIYSKNEYFGHDLEYKILDCHGIKFLEIQYSPTRYNPITKKLSVSPNTQFVINYLDGYLEESEADNIFNSVFVNSTFDGVTGDVNKRIPVDITQGGKVAVVYHEDLYNTQTYKDWKAYRESQNFEFVEEIDGSSLSGSRITSELEDAYDQHEMDYVIIIGHEDLIPIPENPSGSNYHYKDYTRFSGSDKIDDVCLGLFLCGDEDEFKNILNHQKWHEQGGAWEDKILMAAGMEGSGTTFARFSSSHYVTPHLDKPGDGLGYTCHRVYKVPRIPDKYGGSGSYLNIPATKFEEWTLDPNPFFTGSSAAKDKVVDYWNDGIALLGHRDHGSGSGTGPSSPSMKYSLFSGTIETKSSPFFTCLNCSSGNFRDNHSRCFSFMGTTQEYGHSVVISATRTSMSGDNDYNHIAMWGAMFPKDGSQGERNMGKIFLAGHAKARDHGRTYFHMFGDPMSNLQCKVGGTPVVDKVKQIPTAYNVHFDGTRIHFEVPANSKVKVALYTPQGKLVKTLLDGKVTEGFHALPVGNNNAGIANGMYLCRLEAADFIKTINMVFFK